MSVVEESCEASGAGPGRVFTFVSAILAVFLWGSWGWFANAETAASLGVSPATSAITQGVFSGWMTLVMVRANTWLFGRLVGNPLALLLPTILIVSTTSGILTFAHYCVGTPNILLTVGPPIVVALGFNLVTTYKLSRTEAELGDL